MYRKIHYRADKILANGKMVRKQIYIPQRQNALPKQLAQARQLSESEIIRQAIESEKFRLEDWL